ncbi:MAG: PAS domain S-box protein [Terriglobales bacterium]
MPAEEAGSAGALRWDLMTSSAAMAAVLGRAPQSGAVLDEGLVVLAASPAFCALLQLEPLAVLGRPVEKLGQGQWDFSALRSGLSRLLPAAGGHGNGNGNGNGHGNGAATEVADFQIEPMLLGVGLPLLWLRAQALEASAAPGRILLWIHAPAPPALPEPAPAASAEIAASSAASVLADEAYLLKLLLETVPDTIFIKDREGRFLQGNQALAAKLGVSSMQEVIGKNDADFFSPDVARIFHARERAIIETGQPVMNQEQREVWDDGHVSWALLIELPLRDANGEIVGTFGITRDITDRHRAEEALRASERRYRALFERNLCGVFRSTVDGRMLDCNDAFATMFGCANREDALARPALEFHLDSESRAKFIDDLRRTGSQANCELLARRVDGREIWTLHNAALVRDENGQEFVEGTIIDITDRRQLEDRLRQAHKMEAVARLAGGIAHDFNNLLTVISGQCEMLLLGSDDGDRRRERVEAIRRAGDRAAGLTRQLLTFSRQLPVSLQSVDLNDCVRHSLGVLRDLLGAEHEMALSLAPDLDSVRGDPGEIEQILMSLAANAHEAMPRRGTFTINTRNFELHADAGERTPLAPGRYVVLAVTDTGVGIPLELQSRIFEPFFTTKPVGKGSGLGLAGVYGMVKLSGGEVRVRSAPGQGATFEIWLPSYAPVPAPAAAAPAPVAEPAPAPAPRTVLLVEDEDGVRSVVKETLEVAGFRVLEASMWQEAIAHCRDHQGPIDLLLTDVVMPEVNGWKLAEQIRSLRPESKLLLISGYAERVIAAQTASGLGANLLLKPFTPEAILSRVREILSLGPAG